MKHNMLQVVSGALFIALSGCIYLPIVEPEPYNEDQLTKVRVGETTRQEIVDVFGRADVARKYDSIWIYGESRWVGSLAVVGPAGSVINPFYAFHDYQFVVVEFDQNIVKHVELVEERNGCSSTGLCVAYGVASMNDEEQNHLSDHSIIVSKGKDDRLAKSFKSVPNMCSLYIYTRDPAASIEIDANPYMQISEKAYLHLLLDPGAHKMRTQNTTFGYNSISDRTEITETEIDCAKDDIVFVEQYLKDGLFTKNQLVFDTIEGNVGRDAILERNLVLSNWADELQEQQYVSSSEIRDDPETCVLHVYQKGPKRCWVAVKINELAPIGLTGWEYMKARMRPGPISVTASWVNRENKLKINCEGKANEFVKVEFEPRFFGACGNIELKLVDESEARAAIKKRLRMPYKGEVE